MLDLFAKDWTAWDEARRAAAKDLAAKATEFAGARGARLHAVIMRANAREAARTGADKIKGKAKRLAAMQAIHARHVAMLSAEPEGKSDQTKLRASLFAHGLEHQQGPYGKVTPDYMAYMKRKVAAAMKAAKAGAKKPVAITATPKIPRTPTVPPSKDMTVKVVPKPKLRSTSTASLFKKFNQEHDDHGRFGGPGGSHDPTGRPVGRPPGAGAPPSAGKLVAQAGIGTAGSVVGGYAAGKAGALAGGALGAAIGGPFAPWTAAGGAIAGNILGSIAGDYVASKIGNSLLGLKERGDGHPVGTAEMIGSTAALLPEAAALIPGARAASGIVGAGARLFAPEATTFASHAASGVVDLGGIAAGQAIDRAAGKTAGSAAGKAVRKDLFEQPKSYDGTFSSMATAAIPHLVGPRAWKTVSGTPFGEYIRQKVKETATRMDDAAEMSGADLTPAKPKDVQAAGQVAGQQQAEEQARQQQQVQMDQQAQQQTMQVQDKTAGNQHKRDMEMNAATHGQKMEFAAAKHKQDMARMKVKAKTAPPPALPFKKAFALPFHSPNDVVSREAQQSGGHANVDFLRRMQESERRSRQIQLLRVFHGPKAENLAQRPGEDEKAYRDRITQVMAQSVRATGDPGRNIFSGGAAGQRPVYHVRKKRTVAKQVAPNANQEGFNLQIEIAKGLNTERRMEQGLVTGWASIIEKDGQIITDHQGDRITPEELTAAAHDFIANSRQGGVLHDEFGKNIGHIVESVVMTRELQKALDIDLKKAGWLITYKVEDPRVKAMVKAGVLKSFSIGGKGHREAVDVDD